MSENGKVWGGSVLVAVLVAIGAWSAREVVRLDDAYRSLSLRLQDVERVSVSSSEQIKALTVHMEKIDGTLQREMQLINDTIKRQVDDLDRRLQVEFTALSNVSVNTTVEMKAGMIREHDALDARLRALETRK